jgi:hypothetical protein
VRDRCRSHRQELHDQRTRLLGASNAAKTVQACVLHAAADAVGDDRDGSRAASLSMDDVVRYFVSWLPPDESASLLAGASGQEQQHQSSRASSSHSGHAPVVAQRTRGSGSSSTARSRTMGAIDEDSTAAESYSSAPPSPPSASTRRTFNGGGGGLTMLSFAAQRALASPSAYLSSSASSAASSVCASPFAMPSTPRALPASLLRSALGAVESHAMPDAVSSPTPPPRALRASPPHPPPRALGADSVPVVAATVQSAPIVSQSFAMEAAPTQAHKSRSEVANDSVSAAPVTDALLDSVTSAPVAEQEEEPLGAS